MLFPGPISILIEELGRLPGIGPKTAQRLAFHLLKRPADEVRRLAQSIVEAREKITYCKLCFNVADGELCELCQSPTRDRSVICVVEEPKEVIAMERTGEYKGVYHVLQGRLSPIEGIGPEELRIGELLDRIRMGETAEVILATNTNVEGEATALYLARLIQPMGVKVTRIARGLPAGGDIDYADDVTLARALEGRREI